MVDKVFLATVRPSSRAAPDIAGTRSKRSTFGCDVHVELSQFQNPDPRTTVVLGGRFDAASQCISTRCCRRRGRLGWLVGVNVVKIVIYVCQNLTRLVIFLSYPHRKLREYPRRAELEV